MQILFLLRTDSSLAAHRHCGDSERLDLLHGAPYSNRSTGMRNIPVHVGGGRLCGHHQPSPGRFIYCILAMQGVVTLIRPVEPSATGIKMKSSDQEAI